MLNPILPFQGPYSLSVRDNNDQRGPHIKHYKIRCTDPKIGYFIAARRAFLTLKELVDHYSSRSNQFSFEKSA